MKHNTTSKVKNGTGCNIRSTHLENCLHHMSCLLMSNRWHRAVEYEKQHDCVVKKRKPRRCRCGIADVWVEYHAACFKNCRRHQAYFETRWPLTVHARWMLDGCMTKMPSDIHQMTRREIKYYPWNALIARCSFQSPLEE